MKAILLMLISTLVFTSMYSKPLNLKAYYNNNIVEISWRTPEKEDVKCYIIEKSKYGKNFCEVVKVNVLKINMSGYIEYFEVDVNPFRKKGFYRLKCITNDGTIYYSETVYTEKNRSSTFLINPFSYKKKKSNAKLNLKDVIVVLVDSLKNEYVAKVDMIEEKNKLYIIRSDIFLPTGEYIIHATSEDVINNKKTYVDGMYAMTY